MKSIFSFARFQSSLNVASIRQNCVQTQLRTFSSFKVDNPYNGQIHCEIPTVHHNDALKLLERSHAAYKNWNRIAPGQSGLIHRQEICGEFLKKCKKNIDKVATDITCTMGKPLDQAKGEVKRMIERGEELISLSTQPLSDDLLVPKQGFFRKICKEPLGVILLIVPWNYPLLCSINSIIPAILAGNSVLIKCSSRAPLIGDYFVDMIKQLDSYDIPHDIILPLHCSHDVTAKLIQDHRIGYVVFTGSVAGGYEIQAATSKRFINSTLELGGKDPAYVAHDADLKFAVETIVDGSMYNAGQSCCGIERCYVHKSLYKDFCEMAIELVNNYRLGDPMLDTTTMGPLAQSNAPPFLQKQVEDAVSKGAEILAGNGKKCHDKDGKGRFFSPTLLRNCDHTMNVMREESFGPILPIQSVNSDEEAVALMNDSNYGLTAAIFTKDHKLAESLAPKIETGTVFMNRCDFVDPSLVWTGVKETGKGISCSSHCFQYFTKLKSYHFRL